MNAQLEVVSESYYAHQKVYPREISGRFARLRVDGVQEAEGQEC